MHPDRGARSIGIGHPRSGDRCTEPQPTTSTPCGSPSTHLQCRRPARGRGMMCTLIHRSSALRASTDAYGACILRMRENLLCSGLHIRPCLMTLRRSQEEHPDRRARLFTRETLGKSKNVTPEQVVIGALSSRSGAATTTGYTSEGSDGSLWIGRCPQVGTTS